MKSSLQTLQRIQKFNIDEQRKILVDLQNKQENCQKNLTRLIAQFEEEKTMAQKMGTLVDFGAYVQRFLDEKKALEDEIEQLQQQIEIVRDKIADMFKEQKTYEIVDNNRQKRKEKEETQKEQKMLDEIGTNNYLKRKK